MTVRAGNLTCVMDIMAPPPRNGFTDTDARPQKVGQLFGRPLPKAGAERFVSPEYLASVTHVFETPYNEQVNPRNWLMFRGRQLNIEFAIDPEERGRRMMIGCTEVVK